MRFESSTRPSTPDSGVSNMRRRMREPPRERVPAAKRVPALEEPRLKMRVPAEVRAGEEALAISARPAMVPVPASSVSRPVASSPARSKRPTITKLARSDEPPWLIKGRVTPVRGMSLVTPPTIRNAWNEMAAVRPVAQKAARSDLARAAVTRPRTAKSMNRMMTAPPPRRPISSPMAEKMKSDSTTGIDVGMPLPMPVPTRPPSASE